MRESTPSSSARPSPRSACSIAIASTAALGALFGSAPAGASEIVLQNDSVVSGGQAIVQAGFVPGDIGAAVLSAAAGDYPLRVLDVQVYVQSPLGFPGNRTFHVRLYDNGNVDPGTPDASVLNVVMAGGFLNLVDVSGLEFDVASGPFTAGAQLVNGNLLSPNLVTDADGCQAGKNRIFDSVSSQWSDGCALGISGDLFIRSKVETNIPETYGSGLAGAGGFVPAATYSGGFAHVGNSSFALDVQQGLGGTGGLLLLGASAANIPALGGTLLVLPLVALPVTLSGGSGVPGAGSASIGLPIPNNPLLHLTPLFAQWLLFDTAAPANVSFSPGFKFVITNP